MAQNNKKASKRKSDSKKVNNNVKTDKNTISVFSEVISVNPIEDAKAGLGTTLKLITSALTLVSALAWSDAIKSLFTLLNETFQELAVLGQFGYAILVTFLTVFVINRLEKIQKRVDKKGDEKK